MNLRSGARTVETGVAIGFVTVVLAACGNSFDAQSVANEIESMHPKQCGGLVVHDETAPRGLAAPDKLEQAQSVDCADGSVGHVAHFLRFETTDAAKAWAQRNVPEVAYVNDRTVTTPGALTEGDWKRLKERLADD